MKEVVPPFIYCPRCGNKILLQKLEGKELQEIKKKGYIGGARGLCNCGVLAVLVIQEMPKSPTYTLMFNIYKLKGRISIVGGKPNARLSSNLS